MTSELIKELRGVGITCIHPNEDRLQDGYSCHYVSTFPVEEFINLWVEHKKSQMRDEQFLWRVGGAIVGGMLGLGDGFQIGDLLGSLAGGAIGSLAQESLSKDEKETLNKLQLSWVHVDKGSPIKLIRRHGRPVARYLIPTEIKDDYRIATSFQDGFAGCLAQGAADRLVQSIASEIEESPYFSDQFSDIVKNTFCFDEKGTGLTLKSEEILGQISGPDNVIHDVVGLDTDYGKLVAFKSSIPSHSDY